MIKTGDWVTQYSAGYWKVLAVYPKYADEDYSGENVSWKKGDRLGDWVVLKKGFTPKMKPANACEFVDARWCRPVGEDVLQTIETAFAENPRAKQKFDQAPDLPAPSVASAAMKLSGEQAEALNALFAQLPERFTQEQFWALAAEYRKCVADPSAATHMLFLFSYLWEISDDFQPLHFGPVLQSR